MTRTVLALVCAVALVFAFAAARAAEPEGGASKAGEAAKAKAGAGEAVKAEEGEAGKPEEGGPRKPKVARRALAARREGSCRLPISSRMAS
jgi:hypothetical protein